MADKKIYTPEELTEKLEERLQELDATKTAEELEHLTTILAIKLANTIFDDGEYSYNAETKTISCNTK